MKATAKTLSSMGSPNFFQRGQTVTQLNLMKKVYVKVLFDEENNQEVAFDKMG